MESITTMADALRANTTLVAAVVLYTIAFHIFATLRKPISKIPGPWYSKWTSVVVTYHWLKGNKTYYVHDLHATYGPIVRVSPNEVSAPTVEGVKAIYNSRETFVKSRFYQDFTVGDYETLFNTSDAAFNRRHRRLLGAPMMEANIRTFEPTVVSLVNLTMERMGQEMDERGAADLLKWWTFFSTDVIGELTFGESFRTLQQGKPSTYTNDMKNVAQLGGTRATFPTLIPLTKILPIGPFERARQAARNISTYVSDSLSRYQRLIDSDPSRAAHTLFTKMNKAKDDDKLPFDELCGAAQTYIIAGTDTTAITMTYLTWAVCRRPAIQAKLVEELRTLPADFTDIHLRELPYLRCVIEEALRLYTAVPGGLPRVVPPGGAELVGHHLAQGTVVSGQAYTLHRDSAIFPRPLEFDPERWANPTKEMKDAFLAFGRGPRACLGLNLAWMELRMATAKFFLSFPDATVSGKVGMSDGSMHAKIFFLVKPSGGQCLVER
ncbi:cytochrome P450 [Emericellopsis atlantica]|uniref:Cytochrome P450 n=1 Tax=Emericellopsis atlantica TaxID=2614577 RepID=A0A9P7ZRV7_9HYPO|nr:cytochrome P450 [Emericellopsis atlantica]KAG9257164.1 cytochrome P450 [Emericellopsis atlantica]